MHLERDFTDVGNVNIILKELTTVLAVVLDWQHHHATQKANENTKRITQDID